MTQKDSWVKSTEESVVGTHNSKYGDNDSLDESVVVTHSSKYGYNDSIDESAPAIHGSMELPDSTTHDSMEPLAGSVSDSCVNLIQSHGPNGAMDQEPMILKGRSCPLESWVFRSRAEA